MSKFIAITSLIILGTFEPAFGEDWTGQTPPPAATGSIGPLTSPGFGSAPYVIRCQPGTTLPPCGAGQTAAYFSAGGGVNLNSLPAAAGPGSNLGVLINGAYADPTSPTGLSSINGVIPLDAFAKSSTVSTLSAAVDGMAAQIQSQDNSLRQGVAMSLAMAGTGDIGSDEKVSLSMNWGTFGGQNAVAGGITFRASEHVVFSGGLGAGFRGGLVGGRAGARVGW